MDLYELWIVLQRWKEEFTVKEFISAFPSPNPNKILYDLNKKHLIEKTGWGLYKVNSPKEIVEKKYNVSGAYTDIQKSGLEYSFTGPDSVFIWTCGGYQADRFHLSYPIHIKIIKSELKKWVRFLGSKNIHVSGEKIKRTYFGIFYVLYPVEKLEPKNLDGIFVDKLSETANFCKKHIFTYEPALEMLDEMYNLGLKIKYKEAKTNVS